MTAVIALRGMLQTPAFLGTASVAATAVGVFEMATDVGFGVAARGAGAALPVEASEAAAFEAAAALEAAAA